MASRFARVACAAAAAALALALAACGEVEIDPQKAEQKIASGYEEQVPGQTVESVDCPDEIDNEVGTTAVCEMTLTNGSRGEIDVRVLDEDGNIRWDVAEPSGKAKSG
jgi:hypothetical protein